MQIEKQVFNMSDVISALRGEKTGKWDPECIACIEGSSFVWGGRKSFSVRMAIKT